MNRFALFLVFAAGVTAIAWVGQGYAGSNPLALAMTLLIGAFYLAGSLELTRYQQATAGLDQALRTLDTPPESLSTWLGRVPPALRQSVRLRVEGERIALPGPALTPYLAGLLVLLGMLGTFLGMVATLRGTGVALAQAADLQAIRSSLAAPVQGLGFAFGTSIAGVAASAMLGLLSALCRRDRLRSAQALDAAVATTLYRHSQSHQREETFRLLREQAAAMPVLAQHLQDMTSAMHRQGQETARQLQDGQAAFHQRTEAAYDRLGASVAQSLRDSVQQGAQAAVGVLEPVAQATMAGLAQEARTWHDGMAQHLQAHLDAVSTRLEATTGQVAEAWRTALSAHQADTRTLADAWRTEHAQSALAARQEASQLLDSITARLAASHAELQAALREGDATRLATWTQSLGDMATVLKTQWQQASATAQAQWERLHTESQAQWEQSHAANQSKWDAMQAATLARHQELCALLESSAAEAATQTREHTGHLLAQVQDLLQSAAQAPQAAAEAIAQLRAQINDSISRENATLQERTRLLQTLETLLDGVNHACTEQRTAIDALVTTSSDLLSRTGTQFAQTVQGESERLERLAAQVTGSAVEVASLGEAMDAAVQRFGDASETLGGALQRVEAALTQAGARNDEQLAYYVAQAREVVDLSLLSQKQILQELQQLAGNGNTGTQAA